MGLATQTRYTWGGQCVRVISTMGGISIFFIFFSILIFSLILFLGSYLFSFFFSNMGRNPLYRDFYECGFKSISDSRPVIDIHFSIVGIIFLIYEMEVVIFVPIILNFYNLNIFYIFFLIISFFILGVSYLYEWERYGLDWLF